MWRRNVGAADATIADSQGGQHPVEALSLAALVEDAHKVQRSHALPLPELVEGFLKIAGALERAHARFITHGCIHPRVLLFGRFGEAFLASWGTPPDPTVPDLEYWLAPERTISSHPGPEDDLYALCACLHFALELRPPGKEPPVLAPACFHPLLARGLAADPRLRFHHAAEVVTALVACRPADFEAQADGSLRHRPPPSYRHRLALACVAGLTLAAAGTAAGLWLAGKSAPPLPGTTATVVLEESFNDEGWRSRWRARGNPGQFTTEGGSLTNTTGLSVLVFDRMLAPPVTLEFTAEIPKGSKPGDLSAIWGECSLLDPAFTWPKGGKLGEGIRFYLFQNGAFENTYNGINRYGSEFSHVAYQISPLEIAHPYRIRIEVGTHSVAMWRDGNLVGRHDEDLALRSGTFAILLGNAGKRVRDLRITSLPGPQGDLLTLGEGQLASGAMMTAISTFRAIIQAGQPGERTDRARYLLGVCLQQTGRYEECDAVFAQIVDPTLCGKAIIKGLDRLSWAGDHDRILTAVESVWTSYPWLRPALITRFSELMSQVNSNPRFLDYLDLRERLFPDDDATGMLAASFLVWRKDWERITARYSRYRRPYTNALLALGDNETALRVATDTEVRDRAAIQLGRLAEVHPGDQYEADALCLGGHLDQALAQFPQSPLVFLYAGKPEQAATCKEPEELIALAKTWLAAPVPPAPGDPAAWEAVRTKVLVDGKRDFPLVAEALLRARIRGDAESEAKIRALFATIRLKHDDPGAWFDLLVLPALLDAYAGMPGPLAAVLASGENEHRQHFGQRMAFFGRRVRHAVADQEFLAQPITIEAPAWMALADAIAADLANDRATASGLWRHLSELPRHQRCFDGIRGNPIIDLLIAWRLQTGAAAP